MKINFNYEKAVKFKLQPLGPQKPAFGGFNWWFWIPFIRLRIKSYGIYFDFSWLCYWWSFNVLPYYKEVEDNNCCEVRKIK